MRSYKNTETCSLPFRDESYMGRCVVGGRGGVFLWVYNNLAPCYAEILMIHDVYDDGINVYNPFQRHFKITVLI